MHWRSILLPASFNLKIYTEVRAFYEATSDIMLRHEAQNLIPLGNAIIGVTGKDKSGWRDPTDWLMATVEDSEGIKMTAIMTPPHYLTLFATDNQFDTEVIDALVKGLIDCEVEVPGIMTEKSLAEAFARAYSQARSVPLVTEEQQGLYELTRVNPDIPKVGTLRLAKDSDLSFLPYWVRAFEYDCFGITKPITNDLDEYQHYITDKRLYFLEVDDTPVSMAMTNREMKAVCGVANVYTPPFFRNRGYASACVAGVSQAVLDRGFEKCALYTNLANPTSNKIYQEIGYQLIAESLKVRFG